MKKNCLIIVLIFVNIYLIFQEKTLHDSLKDYSAQDQSEEQVQKEQVQKEQVQNLCKEQSETMDEGEAALPEQDWEPLLAAEYCQITENQETVGFSDLITEKGESCSVEEYIRKKDERILQKIDRRSLFLNGNYCGSSFL